MAFQGEILSILAALFWAVGVILFKKSGESMTPMGLNLFKNCFATLLLVPTISLIGGSYIPDQPLRAWVLLALSGILGIAVADTLFFICLEKLGAGLTAVVDTAYSPIMIVLSWLMLGEDIGVAVIGGGALIMSALVLGSATRPAPGRTRGDLVVGIAVGVLGIFLMGVGIVMVKDVLDNSSFVWAATVRLFFGGLALVPMVLLHPRRRSILRGLMPSQVWKVACPAAFFGTYLAMLAWIGGMKHTDVSAAALLNQLSTIFIFILAATVLKEPFTWRRGLSILLAVSGGILVVFR